MLASSLDDRILGLVTLDLLSFDALAIVALTFSVIIGTRGATSLARRKLGRLDYLFVSLCMTLLFGLVGAVAILEAPLLALETEGLGLMFLIHSVGLVPIVSYVFIYRSTERRLLSKGSDFASPVQARAALVLLTVCSVVLLTLLSIGYVSLSVMIIEVALTNEILALAGIVSIGRILISPGLRKALRRVMVGLVLLLVADLSLIVAMTFDLLMGLSLVISVQVLSSLSIVSGMTIYALVQNGNTRDPPATLSLLTPT